VSTAAKRVTWANPALTEVRDEVLGVEGRLQRPILLDLSDQLPLAL
jgi:hypothetical protein